MRQKLIINTSRVTKSDCKQLLDEIFVIAEIIKGEVSVI